MGYQDTFKRVEMKYLITKEQKTILLEAMEPYMTLDEYGRTTIFNIYYDTPDDALIRRSLEKPVYKEKLRLRSYGIAKADSMVFIELKKKYKGIVYKRRIGTKYREAIDYLNKGQSLDKQSQITKEIDYFKEFYRKLEPRMVISYEREAFAGRDASDLRITFDDNILWRDWDLTLEAEPDGNLLLEDGMVLMEIKVASAIPLWLVKQLSKLGIYQTGYSKYGSAYINKLRQKNKGNEERNIL